MDPPDSSFGCSSCGRNFSAKAALMSHVNSPHHRYKCGLCKTHYSDIGGFRLHLDLAHMGYMCTVGSCPYWSAEEADVAQHIESHIEELAVWGQSLTDPRKPRKFGSPEGPDFLRSSRRKRGVPDPRPHAQNDTQRWPYVWKCPSHNLTWDVLEHFLARRFPGRTFARLQSGEDWIFPAPEKPAQKDLQELAALARPKQQVETGPKFSLAYSGYGFDPSSMACPFRLALEVSPDSKKQHATCHESYKDIPTLLLHLSESVHGVEVTPRALSSFPVQGKIPPLRKAGVCRNCWKVLNTERELFSHLSNPCKAPAPALSNLDKHGILYDAFARRPAETDELGLDVVRKAEPSFVSTKQIASDTQKPPPAVSSSNNAGVEVNILRNFTCCGKAWPMVRDLVQHSIEDHAHGTEASNAYKKLDASPPRPPGSTSLFPGYRDEASVNHIALDSPTLPQPGRKDLLNEKPIAQEPPFLHDFDQTLIDIDELFDPNFITSQAKPSQAATLPHPKAALAPTPHSMVIGSGDGVSASNDASDQGKRQAAVNAVNGEGHDKSNDYLVFPVEPQRGQSPPPISSVEDMKRHNFFFPDQEMPDIFAAAHPEVYNRDTQALYHSCATKHRDISTLLRHLARPPHRLFLSGRCIHSFNVEPTGLSHIKRGVCRRCWAVFTSSDALDQHMMTQCEKLSVSKRQKWQILYNTFTPLAAAPPSPHHGQPGTIDRVMDDVHADRLFNSNPNSSPGTTAPISLSEQTKTTRNEVFAQRLRAANDQHLSAIRGPGPSSGTWPFLHGSSLAPEPPKDIHTASLPPIMALKSYEPTPEVSSLLAGLPLDESGSQGPEEASTRSMDHNPGEPPIGRSFQSQQPATRARLEALEKLFEELRTGNPQDAERLLQELRTGNPQDAERLLQDAEIFDDLYSSALMDTTPADPTSISTAVRYKSDGGKPGVSHPHPRDLSQAATLPQSHHPLTDSDTLAALDLAEDLAAVILDRAAQSPDKDGRGGPFQPLPPPQAGDTSSTNVVRKPFGRRDSLGLSDSLNVPYGPARQSPALYHPPARDQMNEYHVGQAHVNAGSKSHRSLDPAMEADLESGMGLTTTLPDGSSERASDIPTSAFLKVGALGEQARPQEDERARQQLIDSDALCDECGYRPTCDPQWFRGSMARHKHLNHRESLVQVSDAEDLLIGNESEYKNERSDDTGTVHSSMPSHLWTGDRSSYGYAESGGISRTGVQAATAHTDSGYASLPHDKEKAPYHDHQGMDVTAENQRMDQAETVDTMTVYSDDRSQASASRTQRYIFEFVDHLLAKIRHQISEFSGERLEDCLPELLQAFALKVGQSSSTLGHLEVMYFVHKHRRAITLSLLDRLKEDEAHGCAEIEDDTAEAAGMSLEDKLSLWVQKASAAEPDPELHEVYESEAEDSPEIEPLEDDIDLNDLYRYQSLITQSTAFNWLVGSLQRELQLANQATDRMLSVRRRILQGLPTPRRISRKQAVPSVQVIFTAPWDPFSFIEEQGYDHEVEDILGKVITLTGSFADVQATTCEQYLRQTWPSTGKHMLRIIEDTVLRSKADTGSASNRRIYILPDSTRIAATCADQTLTLEAYGTAYSMAEIGEQLGWMISALRSSQNDSTISVFCPTVVGLQRGGGMSQPFHCHIATSCVREVSSGFQMQNGECWHKLFRNPVVVLGYPIPRRQELEAGTGLEIPLDMLVALTDASGISEFDDKTFIKGYSAMLIPTKQVDDLVLWHLLFNADGKRISYTDCRIEALQHIRPTGLKQARHILGWVSHARNNTGSPDANYDIKWSGLGKPRERHAWEKVVISGGDPIGVSASFVVGKKDKGIFAGALGGYASRLKFIAKQYVVLYDLDDRRAWLVDGLSALLHLVRASLEHDQKDVFKPYFLYSQGQMRECAASMHGSGAAAAVLFNPENCSLRLYTESEDTWDEETAQQRNGAHGPETVREIVSKRKITYYCLRDRVLEVFAILEKMVDHLNNVQSENGVGFRLRGTPRNILEGFDFMDVATSNGPIRPHMIKLNICESGRGWTDLLRSIQAVTLFGKGFGELIAPAPNSLSSPACGGCGYGISLPTGKDYLGTCVPLVERILTTRGSTETVPWCLADDIYWHTPGPLFDPCHCTGTTKGTKPNGRVQVLVPSTFKPMLWAHSFASPNELHSEGAIMFSHNWRVPFRLGHQTGQEQKMLEPPDSGVGTSIDSSSARSQLSGSFDDTETQSNDADSSSAHSTGSPTGAASLPVGSGDLSERPDIGSSSRKRKLVDMVVERVKRKVLKTSTGIELEQFPSAGDGTP